MKCMVSVYSLKYLVKMCVKNTIADTIFMSAKNNTEQTEVL